MYKGLTLYEAKFLFSTVNLSYVNLNPRPPEEPRRAEASFTSSDTTAAWSNHQV